MIRPHIDINDFFEDIKGRRVAFCGIGVSNAPLAEMFLRRGFEVTVCDRRPEATEQIRRLGELGAKLRLGEGYMDVLEADIVFRTPAMSWNHPELVRLREQGAVITGELELFFSVCPAPIIAVTGTSGKTTVSTMIARILEAAGKKVWLGGGIGCAMMPKVGNIRPEDVVVCELSSFHLIGMRSSPEIALITNVTPNHLETHRDMGEYTQAMENIFLHQSAFGRAVFNADCPVSGTFIGRHRGEALTFSRRGRPEQGAYADEAGEIYFCRGGEQRRIMNVRDIRVPGAHNVENYLAAICVTEGLAGDEAVLSTAHLFGGVENCAQFVRCLDGVCYYNDSIATTPDRTVRGMLSLFDRRIILIAGGHDKKLPFEGLGAAIADRVSRLVLIGAAADEIERAVRAQPDFDEQRTQIYRAGDMAEAVRKANELAQDGDIVALSPACSSFDMYPNFEARGADFIRQVGRLRSKAVPHDDDDDEEGYDY